MPPMCVRHCAWCIKKSPPHKSPRYDTADQGERFCSYLLFTDGEKTQVLQLISERKIQICLTPKLVSLIIIHTHT